MGCESYQHWPPGAWEALRVSPGNWHVVSVAAVQAKQPVSPHGVVVYTGGAVW